MTRHERIRWTLDSISTIAMVAAATAVVWMAIDRRAELNARSQGAQRGWEEVKGLETSMTPEKRPVRSRIAVVEFFDFQCPFCALYATQTFPTLHREFVETGKVEYVFRHLPLKDIHPQALKASEAAECAGEQGQFLSMRSRLFTHPRSMAESDLVAHAETLGLDASRFRTCLAGTMAERVKNDMAEAARLGVNTTPTFLLGQVAGDGKITLVRKILGAVPYSTLRASIDDLLKSVPSVSARR